MNKYYQLTLIIIFSQGFKPLQKSGEFYLSRSCSPFRYQQMKLLFFLFLQINYTVSLRVDRKHLVTGPEGNSEFFFPRISMFPETKSRETLRFEGNKIHCFPRDQSLSDLLYSKTKQKQSLKNAMGFLRQNQATFNCTLWSRATAVNISRVTVNCFPFDVIVFAMLSAQGIWRETVSLLDVMWPWTSQWMGAL